MRLRNVFLALPVATLVCAGAATAAPVITATTSVSLDVPLLESVTEVTSVFTAGTSTPYPGFDLGFPITGSTDFDTDTLTGEIDHTGSIGLVVVDAVTLGDFAIGYDATRVVPGETSGFYVENTIATDFVVFDIAEGVTIQTLEVDANLSVLTIKNADLLVSQEFADLLEDGNLLKPGLTAADVVGADLGDARVDAFIIPEPGTAALLGLAAMGLVRRSRR